MQSIRDLVARARSALYDYWREEPARVVGYVVTVLSALGVGVATRDAAAALAVLVPLIAGTEGIRSRVTPAYLPGHPELPPSD